MAFAWALGLVLFSVALLDQLATTAAADSFDQLRVAWAQSLTGGTNYSLADNLVKSRLSNIETTASNYWSSMKKSVGRTTLWSDLTSTNESGQISTAYSRLRSMALAYATYGSTLRSNATLAADIKGGLDWMYANRYNESLAEYDNWYDWEIGSPLNLTDLATLMYDAFGLAGLSNSLNAVNHFVPLPATNGHSGTFTGSNLADKLRVVAVRGIVVKDAVKVASARDALSLLFPSVTTGEQFYADGSFIHHRHHPYNGAYGEVLLTDISFVLPWLSGSPWQCQDPAQTNVYQWVYNGFEPLIYFGSMMDMTRGRSVARSSTQDHVAGADIIQSILRLSQFAPPADAGRMRSMVKYWAQVDTFRSFTNNVPLPLITATEQLMADAATVPRGELVGHWTYASMDRVVHLRPGWGLGLSLSSSRVYNYESISSENLHGWFQGDGVTYVYNADLAQFSDDFWPTIDPYRLPGATVETTPRADGSGESYLSAKSWVGGATLFNYGAAGLDLNPKNSPLIGKKSWFMLDDGVVCLGTGITCTNSATVQTTIENRKIRTDNTNLFIADGTKLPSALGWSTNLTNSTWCVLEGAGAYYFPGGATIKALREARTNSWSHINSSGPTNLTTENYLTLWLDHGTHPTNASYAYVLLPNFSGLQASNYAVHPSITILENSTDAQAVKETALNIVAANFWNNAAKTVDLITVDKRASVLTRETAANLSVAVADPTQTNTGSITLMLNRSANGVAFADPAITIIQLRPTIQFSVNVNRALGRSFVAKFNFQNSTPSLAPLLNRTINAGSMLTVTNSATDADLPYQTLAFSLLAAPANAVINPTNGVFSWRPTVAQAGSTNLVSISVADDGTPSLSATQSFNVTVNNLSLPSIAVATITNGQFTMLITGDTGPDYSMLTSTNLLDWAALYVTNSPTLPFVWTDAQAGSFPKRFYRVLLGP